MPTTELPITEADVNVVTEASVELAKEKFADLLRYLTQLEDEVSIAKFDLESEHEFAQALLFAIKDVLTTLESARSNLEPTLIAGFLWARVRAKVERAIQEGSISPSYRERLSRLTEEIAQTVNTEFSEPASSEATK